MNPTELRDIADELEAAQAAAVERATERLNSLIGGRKVSTPAEPVEPTVALGSTPSASTKACPDCGKTYAYAKAMRTHRATHTNNGFTFQ